MFEDIDFSELNDTNSLEKNQTLAEFLEKERISTLFNTVLFLYILSPICCIGILGNILNIVIFFKIKKRSPTFIFLKALSISDMFACICWLAAYVNFKHGSTYTLLINCLLEIYLYFPGWNVFVGVSNFITVFATLERFIAVCYPTVSMKFMNEKTAKIISMGVFFFGGSFSLNSAFQFGCVPAPLGLYRFFNNMNNWFGIYVKLFTWLREVIVHLIPLTLIPSLNLRTVWVFHKHSENRGKMTFTKNEQKMKNDKKLLLLKGITILYVCCTTPITLFFILNYKGDLYVDGIPLREQIWLGMINTFQLPNYVLPFTIYLNFNREYRNVFLSLFCPAKVKPQDTHADDSDAIV